MRPPTREEIEEMKRDIARRTPPKPTFLEDFVDALSLIMSGLAFVLLSALVLGAAMGVLAWITWLIGGPGAVWVKLLSLPVVPVVVALVFTVIKRVLD